MTDATTASSTSTAVIVADIVRLITPDDRTAFNQMLEIELRGRGELPAEEVRRAAVDTWRQFFKHGWPRS